MPRILGEELQGLVQSGFGSVQEFGYNKATAGARLWEFYIDSAALGAVRREVLIGWL